MTKKAVFLTAYFLAPVLLIAAIYFSHPAYYGSTGFLPMVLGTVAYTLLNAQLILGARPKWVERYFGLDRFYRFHSLMAMIAIGLALFHKLLEGRTFSENFQTNLGDLAIILFIGAAVLALVFMADTLSRLFPPLKQIRRFFTRLKIGKYSVQVILHNVNVAAVVLIFAHVMLTRSARVPLVAALYSLYFGAAMGFYLYHKVIRRYFGGKRFAVEQIIRESDTMTTLVLRPQSGTVFHYLPGQFGFLRVRGISGEEHPFSISSQPLDRERLSLTIKDLGDWTLRIRTIETGSQVSLDAPYGRFSPTLFDCRDGIVLIAGGVGITPMLSILRYYVQAERNQKIVLFWGVSRLNELIRLPELGQIQRAMPYFTFVPVANDPDFDGRKGYITQQVIGQSLAGLGYERDKLQYFFCGPAPMWTSIRKGLKSTGVKSRMIHAERFSL